MQHPLDFQADSEAKWLAIFIMKQILGPDQTAVTWWFLGHSSPFPCPDTSPDSQPSPSCLQGACF